METPTKPEGQNPGVPTTGFDPTYSEKVYGGAAKLLGDKYPNISREQFDKNLHNPEFVKGLYLQIKATGKAANLPDFDTFSQKITPTVKEKPRNWLDQQVGDLKSITDIPSREQMIRFGQAEYKKRLREVKSYNEEAGDVQAYSGSEGETPAPVELKNIAPADKNKGYREWAMSFAKDAVDSHTDIKDHAARTVNNIAEYALSDTEKREFAAIKKTETVLPYYRQVLQMEEKSKGENGKPLTAEEQIQVATVKKAMAQNLSEYESTVSQTHARLDADLQLWVTKREQMASSSEPAENKEAWLKYYDKKISEINGRKQFFLDPTKYTEEKVKQYGLEGDMFDGLSPRQKLTAYLLSKYQETKEILGDYGYKASDINRFIDPVGKSTDPSSFAEGAKNELLDFGMRLDQMLGFLGKDAATVRKNLETIQDLAPVALVNRNPITGGGEENPVSIFAKKAWSTTFGENTMNQNFGLSGTTATNQERSQRLLDAFTATGADYSTASPEIKSILDEKSKPYGAWTSESLAETMGVTTGILLPAMIGGGAARSGLKGASLAGKGTRVGNVAEWVLKGESRFSRVVRAGIEYETGGQIFRRQNDELDLGSGMLGQLGAESLEALGKRIKLTQFAPFIQKLFKGKEEETTRRMVTGFLTQRAGAGAGETAEETFQSVYQMYRDSESSDEFRKQLQKQFGSFNEASFFVASTFLMGMAMGGASDRSGTQMATEMTGKQRAVMTPEEKRRQSEIELKLLGERNEVISTLVSRKLAEASPEEIKELVDTGNKAVSDLESALAVLGENSSGADVDSAPWTINGGYGTIAGNGQAQLKQELEFQKDILAMGAAQSASRNVKKPLVVTAKKTVPGETDVPAEFPSIEERQLANAPTADDRLSMAVDQNTDIAKKAAWLASVDMNALDTEERAIMSDQMKQVSEAGYEIAEHTQEKGIDKSSEVIPDISSKQPAGTVTKVFANEVFRNGELVSPGKYMVSAGTDAPADVSADALPEEVSTFNKLSHANRFRKQVGTLAANFAKSGKTKYEGAIAKITQKNGSRTVATVNGKEMKIAQVSRLPESIKNMAAGESVPVTLNYVQKSQWNPDGSAKRADGTPYGDKIEIRDMEGNVIGNVSEGIQGKVTEGKRKVTVKNAETGSEITVENDATLVPSGTIDLTMERAMEESSRKRVSVSREKESILAKLDSNRKPCI